MKLPRRAFLHWPQALPHCQWSRTSLWRNPIRRGRCGSLSDLPPVVATTSWHA